MKRAYTNYSPYFKQWVKGLDGTPEQVWDVACKAGFFEKEEISKEFQIACWIDVCVIKGNATHVFIPNAEFCDWLVKCVPDHGWVDHAIVLQQLTCDYGVTVVHFPTGMGRYSYAVRVFEKERMVISFSSHSKEIIGGIMLLEDKEISFHGTDWYAKLIVGLGMYIGCFPEAVKDGPPEDIKHPAMHSHKNSITVSVSPKVQQAHEHGSPTPHFRRGHFRILRSDKFTNKRFQSVFVREAFVAGKAITVLPPDAVPAAVPRPVHQNR